MDHFWLTDEQFARIAPLASADRHVGQGARDDRA